MPASASTTQPIPALGGRSMSASLYAPGGAYIKKHPSWHAEDSAWKAKRIMQLIARNGLRFSSVCDVGCGAGEISRILAASFPSAQFTGFEISPDAFVFCQAKSTSNLHYENAQAFESGRSFDVAMAIDVFEHVDDYFGFVRNMRNISKYQIYHIPLDLSAQALLRREPLQKVRETVGHIHYFSKDTALATLKDTGHEIVDWFYTKSAIELSTTSILRKLAAGPRAAVFAVFPDFAVRTLGGFSMMVLCC
jgi:ubiquinone/menaquinone biosynthesis C-methylase UbiE